MANTFLFASGYDIGNSLCEVDMDDQARDILEKALSEKCEVVLSADDWTVLHRPVVTARGLADTTLLDLFALNITHVARGDAPEIVAATSACSPIDHPSNPLQFLQQVDNATRRAWETGFAEVLPGNTVTLDDSPRITLTVRVGAEFPEL